MSIKNQKNVIVIAGVITALLAGTVLLGGYAKFAPAKAQTDSTVQVKACCPMMGAQGAQESELSCPHLAKAGFDAEACPMGRTEPCCEGNPPKDCCGKPCPPDCPKPCCAKEATAGGCTDSTAGARCPATTSTATK